MSRLSFSSRLLRSVAVSAGLVALGVIAFTPAASAAAKKHATINTYKGWAQNSVVLPFGCPNSTTYGETIKIPAGKSTLGKFQIYMSGQAGSGQSMVVRGELYAWDGSKATGSAIFETTPQTIAFGDSLWHKVTFNTQSAPVTPGGQYVIFASIDKDYESCTGNYGISWGATATGAEYPDGVFVFQNNSGNESNWTTMAWSPISSLDAVMKVYMG